MMRRLDSDKLYTIFVLLLIFGICQLSIKKLYGFSLYPDEFGYWASAAPAAGYDWSAIASLGSYYSFGYSIILAPVLILFKNGIAAYRAAIYLNFIFVAAGFLILNRLFEALFKDENAEKRILICGFSALYPPWMLYSQMTMAESLIIFLFILLCFLMVRLMENPGILRLVPVIAISAYMYFVHMRMIGVVCALLLTFVIWGLGSRKTRTLLLWTAAMGCLLALVFVIAKKEVISGIYTYAGDDELSVNDYGSQLWKMRHILTPEGFAEFICETAGKIYYLMISTYGLFHFAMVWSIKAAGELFKSIKYSKKTKSEDVFGVFLLLACISEILISSIYMHGSDRADALLYGRYDEFVSPVIMITGARYVCTCFTKRSHKGILAHMGTIFLFVVAMTPVFTAYLNKKGYSRLRGFFVSGASYLNGYYEYEPGLFMKRAAISGLLMVAMVITILVLAEGHKFLTALISLCLALGAVLSVRLGYQWTYRINSYVKSNLSLVERFEDNDERKLYYLDIDDNYYVDFIQFNLPKREIVILNRDDRLGTDMSEGYLIVNRNYEKLDEITREYDGYYESEMLRTLYNE